MYVSILCLKGCVLDSFVPNKVHIYYTDIPQSVRSSLNGSTHFKHLKVNGPDKQDVCCLGGWLCLCFHINKEDLHHLFPQTELGLIIKNIKFFFIQM
jgi:hypothetical protein